MASLHVGRQSPRHADVVRWVLAWLTAFTVWLMCAPASAVTFVRAAGSPFATGNEPTQVVVGDFNRDGKPDLAVAGDHGVWLLLGDGTGAFTATPKPPVVGGYPDAIAAGDFNRDGNLDLIVEDGFTLGPNVGVLLGDGSGSFGPAPGSPFSGGFAANLVADFNLDATPDLVASGGLLLGDGAGGFTPGPAVDLSHLGVSTVGDLNGDGKPDLVGSSGMLLGDGAGNFTAGPTPPTMIPFDSSPTSAAVGDFNGDGKQDLAVAYYSSQLYGVSALLGNGTGGLTVAHGSPIAVGVPGPGAMVDPTSLVVADFNADGKQDLAATISPVGDVSVMLGNGAGGFAPATGSPFATGSHGAYQSTSGAGGDFNGDGRPDLAIANFGSSNVSVLLDVIAPASATTGAVTTVDRTTATLNGTVDRSDPDVPARYHFDYGTSTAYGTRMPASDVPVVTAPVSQSLWGLQPSTTYHYRLVVIHPTGTTYGLDQTFTTLGPPVNTSPPTISGTPASGSPLTCASGSWSGVSPTFSYQWTRNGMVIRGSTQPKYIAAVSDIGRLINCVVTATNTFGTASAHAAGVRIIDRTPPRLTGLRITPGKFAAQRRGPSLLLTGRLGAKVRYWLSERATVVFTIERAAPGGKRNRYVLLGGSFKQSGKAGLNMFRFTGRLRNATLKPETYRLIAIARDSAGNRSAPVRCSFTVRG
jgi:FG-GAP-like repeat